VNTYLLYSGLALALILRFEFMGKGFAKFINILTTCTIGLIVLSFLDQIFGNGTLLS
jgi:xanthine/uracil permease